MQIIGRKELTVFPANKITPDLEEKIDGKLFPPETLEDSPWVKGNGKVHQVPELLDLTPILRANDHFPDIFPGIPGNQAFQVKKLVSQLLRLFQVHRKGLSSIRRFPFQIYLQGFSKLRYKSGTTRVFFLLR
jgi:hypothetical protein